MFVYEKDNKVNVVLKGNLPSENPDITIGEGVGDVGEITLNGKKVAVEVEGD